MPPLPTPPEQIALIVAQYPILKTYKEVGRVLGISAHRVKRALQGLGIPLLRYRTIDDRRDDVTADYMDAKLTNPQICAKYGLSQTELGRAFRRWGLKDPTRKTRLAAYGSYVPNAKSVYDCWVENYGQEEADRKEAASRAARSKRSSGAGNNMYGKPSPHGAGNGWKGWYRDHYFRSLREACYMLSMDKAGVKWVTGETLSIPYVFNGTERTYRPDYIVGKRLVEVKPVRLHATPEVSAKRAAAEAYCLSNGLTYTLTDVEIDVESVHQAYQDGLIRFSHDYEKRFLDRLAEDKVTV